MWRTRALGAALVAALSLPAATYYLPDPLHRPARNLGAGAGGTGAGPWAVAAGAGPTSELGAYGGLASWVDMYDKGPWRHPGRTAERMAERGTRTLFLQTSNYNKKSDIYKPSALSRLLEASHANGMKVVA